MPRKIRNIDTTSRHDSTRITLLEGKIQQLELVIMALQAQINIGFSAGIKISDGNGNNGSLSSVVIPAKSLSNNPSTAPAQLAIKNGCQVVDNKGNVGKLSLAYGVDSITSEKVFVSSHLK